MDASARNAILQSNDLQTGFAATPLLCAAYAQFFPACALGPFPSMQEALSPCGDDGQRRLTK
jgi:hypothetical protein